MNREQLIREIKQKKSFLCIGLDTDPNLIPEHLKQEDDPVFEFNKSIIEATSDLCVAYKPNLAFYESSGLNGLRSLVKTMNIIPDNIFTIADAKRGDIGNTATRYAQAFFDPSASGFNFDSVTVAPYMGSDSVKPFLEFEDKWVILLLLTSNEGAKDFQLLSTEGKPLYQQVLERSQSWGSNRNLMYVVGATRGSKIKEVRDLAPDHFFLVPGVGAQGGSLEEVAQNGMTKDCGLLINSSRQIIYAGNGEDFAEKARLKALELQQQMEVILSKAGIV